jgi:hypothetical protein
MKWLAFLALFSVLVAFGARAEPYLPLEMTLDPTLSVFFDTEVRPRKQAVILITEARWKVDGEWVDWQNARFVKIGRAGAERKMEAALRIVARELEEAWKNSR